MIQVNCKQCGKEFKTYNSQIKRGGGKFCSISCGTTFRNLTDNPSKREEVRAKISKNHADVSGEKNPMYGRKGKDAPSYVDGTTLLHPAGTVKYIRLAALHYEKKCHLCDTTERLEVHHRDGNRKNNEIDNLMWLCKLCHNTKAHTYVKNEKGQVIKIITHYIER